MVNKNSFQTLQSKRAARLNKVRQKYQIIILNELVATIYANSSEQAKKFAEDHFPGEKATIKKIRKKYT